MSIEKLTFSKNYFFNWIAKNFYDKDYDEPNSKKLLNNN